MKDTIKLQTPPCIVCWQTAIVEVPRAAWDTWNSSKPPRKAFVQDAFPMLTAADRELLISGMHDQCFDSLFHNVDILFGSFDGNN